MSGSVLRSSVLATLLVALTVLLGVNPEARRLDACGGDPPPPRCGKTLVFTMAVPRVVKNSEEPIEVRVPTLTFFNIVEIPPGSGVCPRPPYRATIELSLDCGPGVPVPAASSVTVDMSPGYNPVAVPITIPPGPARKCVISGKVTMVFTDGMRISRSRRSCICIVDCSEKDTSLPRLDLAPVVPGTAIARVAPGDQTSHRYVITNNDERRFYRGLLEVVSSNAARRPIDESAVPAAPGTGVFAVSDPEFGDDFPIAFADQLDDCIVLPPEPQTTVTPTLFRPIVLGPCESIEVEVVARPWGMCANGSCGEVSLLLEGHFSDGTRGVACAAAVVAIDTSVEPRFAWPDAGEIGRLQISPDLMIFRGRALPDLPPLPLPVGFQGAQIALEGEPLPTQPSTQLFPLSGAAVEIPEKGRFENQNRLRVPLDDFVFDSFFDVEYRINFPGPGVLQDFQMVPDAPHGFADVGPLGMGVLQIADADIGVAAFADFFYQLSGQGIFQDATGGEQMLPLAFEDVQPTVQPDHLLFRARARVRSRAVPAGGAGGIIGVPSALVGIDLYHDVSTFMRAGPGPVCPQPTIVDLNCRSDGEQVCLWWNTRPAKCDCERIEIRDRFGNVLVTLPGDVNRVCIPCDQLESPQGVLCVVCIGPDGEETVACCEYDCRPCPPVEIVRCAVDLNGNLVVRWNPLPDDCCERIRVRHVESDTVLAVFPGGATGFVIPCEELPSTSGTICVECVDADGTVRSRDCCDYRCEVDCPPVQITDCQVVDDPATGPVLRLTWNPMPDDCCDRIRIVDGNGNTLLLLPTTATSAVIPCSQLPDRSGVVCVQCVRQTPQGLAVVDEDCCDYVCPCPPLEVGCRVVPGPAGPTLVASWNAIPPGCCDGFRIFIDGVQVGTAGPNDTTFSIPCGPDIPQSGELCVVCFRNGERVDAACCRYECPDPCVPLEIVRCQVNGTAQGPVINIGWNAIPEGCCDGFRIFIDGVQVGAVGPDATSFSIPCSPNIPQSGEICVVCYRDGEPIDEACCRYDCSDPCPPLELLRCGVVNDVANGPTIVVGWAAVPEGCCDGFRIFIDGNQVGAVGPDATSFSIPCSPEIPQSGEICVVCYRDGEPIDRVCCRYECPEPCPPIDATCEVVRDTLTVSWNAMPDRCCDRIVVRAGPNGPVLAALPPTATSFSILCDDLPARQGEICVECVDADGTVHSRDCCEYRCPPCPRTEILRCETVDGRVVILWNELPANCCRGFQIIHRPTGQVVGTLPAGATIFSIPCEELPTRQGALCVVCIDPDGNPDPEPPCCQYDCRECPPIAVECESTGDAVIVSWTPLPEDCCERFVVRLGPGGPVLATLPGNASSARIPCADLPEPTGVICVECVDADGNVTSRDCCEYRCRECPPLEVNCDPTGDTVVVTWNSMPEGCCERIVVRAGQNGPVIATLPGDETSIEIPCDQLPAAAGVICVECVDADGNVTSRDCCEYRCRECPPLEVNCDPTGDTVVVAWNPMPEGCCERIVVRAGPNGPVIATLPGDATSIEIPCDELPAITGEICVECVDASGNVTSRDCCEYRCRECPEIRLECEVVDTADGVRKVVMRWNRVPEECCARFIVRHRNGTDIAVLPAGSDMFMIPCRDLFELTDELRGTLCLICVAPDGTESDPVCCDYSCVRTGNQVPFDCNQDGNLDIGDAVCLLGFLFLGFPTSLPCAEPGTTILMDWDGGGNIDLSDAAAALNHLFLGGPPHTLGGVDACVPVPNCPDNCRP